MSDSTILRQIGPKPRPCGCKGIRSCKQCMIPATEIWTPLSTFDYCQHCKKAWQVSGETQQYSCSSGHNNGDLEVSFPTVQTHSSAIHESSVCGSGDNSIKNSFNEEHRECAESCFKDVVKPSCRHVIEFEGIEIVENFVTEEEETYLNSNISSSIFVNSQSGRRKQDYGPKVNFKKQKLKAENFKGLPSYSRFLYERMKTYPCLSNFEPVELCNLEYCQNRGAHIDPHFDDFWLWGERLVTLNLLSDSTLTFTLDSDQAVAVRVPLQRRSLIVVSSAARHKWKHSIMSEDIGERRLAMTFRELSKEFSSGGSREYEGAELLRLALTFEGCAVSG